MPLISAEASGFLLSSSQASSKKVFHLIVVYTKKLGEKNL